MDSRDLRVSDAEREHVGQLLQQAVGQGMLSLGEFTERMDTVLAAKTRADVNQVLVDLPGIALRPEYLQQIQAQHMPVQAPASGTPSAAGAAVIRGRMSNLSRKGRWEVPSTVRIDTRMSTVVLDFTEAVMRTQVVHIDLNDYLGSVTLIVPMEATADVDSVDMVGSSTNSKVRSGAPFGPLHLVVTGKLHFSSLTVRHPLGTALRKLLR
ncbi:MAG: DUF1707 domain-containing protein [Rhodococcus sp. (in: high G+C Gram-positive bacteria)]|uniref:DUF1707 SHOCT-like domain-containing protein n=1 Tax=Rhodococcus sp. TaxID=1831 RepID=UPI003BB6DFAD